MVLHSLFIVYNLMEIPLSHHDELFIFKKSVFYCISYYNSSSKPIFINLDILILRSLESIITYDVHVILLINLRNINVYSHNCTNTFIACASEKI